MVLNYILVGCPCFVLYHIMLSGNFYGSEIRHRIFLVLKFGPRIFLGFDFCPYSIIPVTWNPKCPLLGDHTCHILNGVCPLVPVLTPAYNSTVPEASVLLLVCWLLLLRLSFQPGLVHYGQKSIVYWPSGSILKVTFISDMRPTALNLKQYVFFSVRKWRLNSDYFVNKEIIQYNHIILMRVGRGTKCSCEGQCWLLLFSEEFAKQRKWKWKWYLTFIITSNF